jgi:hypothetical protein
VRAAEAAGAGEGKMLTVKHAHHQGETIYSGVKQVHFTPTPNAAGGTTMPDQPGVRFDFDGSSVHIGGGEIFVMNETGRTVQTYRL